MFSLGKYPIAGKDGLPLCEEHGRLPQMKEVVVIGNVTNHSGEGGIDVQGLGTGFGKFSAPFSGGAEYRFLVSIVS